MDHAPGTHLGEVIVEDGVLYKWDGKVWQPAQDTEPAHGPGHGPMRQTNDVDVLDGENDV